MLPVLISITDSRIDLETLLPACHPSSCSASPCHSVYDDVGPVKTHV
jgi:hypothetical protein